MLDGTRSDQRVQPISWILGGRGRDTETGNISLVSVSLPLPPEIHDMGWNRCSLLVPSSIKFCQGGPSRHQDEPRRPAAFPTRRPGQTFPERPQVKSPKPKSGYVFGTVGAQTVLNLKITENVCVSEGTSRYRSDGLEIRAQLENPRISSGI